MKGTYFLGAQKTPKFEVRDMEFAPLGKHEVLVKNMACGICGTDVHIYHGEAGSADVTPPVVLGHEFSGIVMETGDAVTTVSVGDHVAMDPNLYCGKCLPCRMGKKQNCEHLSALGVTRDGGFAEYAVCPESQCFVVNKEIDFDVAAMAEPLACVVHGIDQAAIRPGQAVLVIGGGTIGLLMVQMDVREKIREICGRDGADVVIECVGKPFAVEQAFYAAGFGATLLLFSVPATDATVALPLFDVSKKELRILGSMINPDTHQRAVNLINGHCLEIKKLITHAYDLEHLDEAIHMQMSSESIKVMVHPWG